MHFFLALMAPLVVVLGLTWTRAASTASLDDSELANQWLTYKQQHGRRYSAAEDQRRLAIFAANLAAIQQVNSDPSSSYTATVNQFTDRTSAELQQSLGLNPLPEPTSASTPRFSRVTHSTTTLAPSTSADENATTTTDAANSGSRKKRGIIVTDASMLVKRTGFTLASTTTTTTARTTTTAAGATTTTTARTTTTTTTARTTTTTTTARTTTTTTTARTTTTTTTARTTTTTTTARTTTTTTTARTTTTTTTARTTTTTARTTTTTVRTTTTSTASTTSVRRLPNGAVIYYAYGYAYYLPPQTTTTTTTTQAPPDAWDWTTASPPVVNTPSNQGSCGCCWAFATTGAIEGQYALKTGNLKSFSKQLFVDCSTSNYGCNGGDLVQALKDLRYRHVETEANYPPYAAVQGTCQLDSVQAFQDMPYNMTPRYFYGSEIDMKHYIATVGPLAIEMTVEGQFYSYGGGVYSTACTGTSVNHGVLLVGYGTDANGVDFWKAKNSWGTSWGEGGFFRIKRNANNFCNFALRVVWPDLTML